MKVIDLFSGLGGFSQAFVDRGHDVTRYEYDERFKEVPCTIIKDVWDLTAEDLKGADIILASPPCQTFSTMTIWRYHDRLLGPSREAKEAIKLVKHTINIIEAAFPRYWVLENPQGMLKKFIGRPVKTVHWCAYGSENFKPTNLWGKHPPFDWRSPVKWLKVKSGEKKGIQDAKLSAAERALIPYDFSLAVCLAAEGNSIQQTLEACDQ